MHESAERARIFSTVGHHHWNGWVRTSSVSGSQSLELDVRNAGIHNLIDDFNRKALAMDVDLSLPTERVVHALDQMIL